MKYFKLCLLLCLLIAWPTDLSAGKKVKKPIAKVKVKKKIAIEKTIKPYVVFTGIMDDYKSRSCLKITSKNDWAKLWLESQGIGSGQEEYDYYYNTLKVPEIDFDKCMVIAVFEDKGTLIHGSLFGGFTATGVVDEQNMLVLRFDMKTCEMIEYSDSLQITEPQEKTTVYSFFVIPRSQKKIIIQIDVRDTKQRSSNAPFLWKEYARIER